MSGYVKLFTSILGSTVWIGTPAATKVVWITLLATADRDGEVRLSVPGLAQFAGVTIAECEVALASFLGPDPYSTTKEHEGRRIEVVDGGWRLLNHDKYRDLMSTDDRRERAAARQQRHRDRHKGVTVTPSNAQSHAVTENNASNDIQIPAPAPAPAPAPDPEADRIGVGANRADAPAPAAPALLIFPASGSVATWALTRTWLETAQAAYPGIDVMAEMRIALAKIENGACKRPTARGMSRFLMNWLTRTNDNGPAQLGLRTGSRVDAKTAEHQQMFRQGREWAVRDVRVGHGRADDSQHTVTGEQEI